MHIIQADRTWARGLTGAGWTVAILDTGVDTTHTFLKGKVVEEACFSTPGLDSTSLCRASRPEDHGPGAAQPCSVDYARCDHGTHVAGIAAGRGTSLSGVAPDASIVAAQVFSWNPAYGIGAYDSDIIAGLEWVYSMRKSRNIAAVNMSIGGATFSDQSSCDDATPPLKAMIDDLRAVDIAVVIAAGNNGVTNGLSYPACISSAVSVGSTTKQGTIATYSNSATFLDLLAPGSDIVSSTWFNMFATKSGTSMATPHLTGSWAVLKQHYPDASVTQLLRALKQTGQVVVDTRNGVSTPQIRIADADTQLSNVSLSVAVEGKGSVSGRGIVCPSDCTEMFAMGTTVTLTAVPGPGQRFTGWTNACSSQPNPCTVTVSRSTSLTARFAPDPNQVKLAIKIEGAGTVYGPDIECPGACTAFYKAGSRVTLVPAPYPGAFFDGWSGACTDAKSACTVTLTDDLTLTALFSGMFLRRSSYDTGVKYSQAEDALTKVIAVDVNGDGREDLIHARTNSSGELVLRVHMSDGAGGFAAKAAHTGYDYVRGDGSFATLVGADLNGDGRGDLVHVRTNGAGDLVFRAHLSDGAGGFIDGPSYDSGLEASANGNAFTKMLVGDVNGDGRDDLVHVRTRNNGNIIFAVHLSDGAGGFKPHAAFDTGIEYSAAEGALTKAFTADVNGDGRKDLIYARTNSTGELVLRAYVSDGTGSFVAQPSHNTGIDYARSDGSFASLIKADVNGDGRDDLVHVRANGAGRLVFRVLLSDGAGGFISGPSYDSGLDASGNGNTFARVFVADVNGDGRDDVVHVRTNDEGNLMFAVHLSDDAGGFKPQARYDTGRRYSPVSDPLTKLFAADLNGDRRTDIVYVHTKSDDHITFVPYLAKKQ